MYAKNDRLAVVSVFYSSQVVCDSTHATSFAVRCVTETCPFCTHVPVSFWELELKVTLSRRDAPLSLAVLTLVKCAWLHVQDRVDWIPPRRNMEAYFPPWRPVRRRGGHWWTPCAEFLRRPCRNGIEGGRRAQEEQCRVVKNVGAELTTLIAQRVRHGNETESHRLSKVWASVGVRASRVLSRSSTNARSSGWCPTSVTVVLNEGKGIGEITQIP